jgi:hypothetical protein
MPITFEERPGLSGNIGQGDTTKVPYLARGSTDIEAVKAAAKAEYPTYGDKRFDDASVEPVTNGEDGLWNVDITFKDPEGGGSSTKESGESSFTFDTAGATQHLTQSRGTTIYQRTGTAFAPDCKGAIGVTNDSVEGVDTIIPQFEFEITRYIAPEDMTQAFIGKLYQLTGKVNNAPVTFNAEGIQIQLQAGECLFMGARGSKRGKGDWELSLRYGGSPNVADLFPGGPFVGPVVKKGWQYAWTLYEDVEDTDAMKVIKRPIGCYIEDVYEEADLSPLI